VGESYTIQLPRGVYMSKCKCCGHEIEENTIIIGDYEYETKTHDFNKYLKDIKIPKCWELWSVSDFEKFNLKDWDNLNLKDTWFYIKHPFAFNPNNNVSGFSAVSGGASFNCYRYPTFLNDGLGVRFKRKIKAVEDAKEVKDKVGKLPTDTVHDRLSKWRR